MPAHLGHRRGEGRERDEPAIAMKRGRLWLAALAEDEDILCRQRLHAPLCAMMHHGRHQVSVSLQAGTFRPLLLQPRTPLSGKAEAHISHRDFHVVGVPLIQRLHAPPVRVGVVGMVGGGLFQRRQHPVIMRHAVIVPQRLDVHRVVLHHQRTSAFLPVPALLLRRHDLHQKVRRLAAPRRLLQRQPRLIQRHRVKGADVVHVPHLLACDGCEAQHEGFTPRIPPRGRHVVPDQLVAHDPAGIHPWRADHAPCAAIFLAIDPRPLRIHRLDQGVSRLHDHLQQGRVLGSGMAWGSVCHGQGIHAVLVSAFPHSSIEAPRHRIVAF